MPARLAAALLLLLHVLVPAAGHSLPHGHAAADAPHIVTTLAAYAVRAPGHAPDERAGRPHVPAGASALSGGLAVLPDAARPAPRHGWVADRPAGGPPWSAAGRTAAPVRAPPPSTR
ncbi:hypothetical protein [Thermoactinospora rubra]|uniref:hypothetical protein n=1 Tax=Thermoactinospora rubra TaxID=1088767 RepID=UPI000A11C2B3|nr:hypothetical protein [Thermoactinospora rubra]